ncbi:MAG: peptide chain release factor N(5)-glutamine methyltransferase [Prevotella sp.]|jgi:release factor glutamine methyltransferase
MTYTELWRSLTPLYSVGEAQAVTRTVLDLQFGLSLTDLVCGKVNELSADGEMLLKKIFKRLQQGEPVQYVLGLADFCGHTFHVNPSVLIPRPETAQLVKLTAERMPKNGRVLDIGTGSGCIAVSLALLEKESYVEAWDISDAALTVAAGNALRLGAKVAFRRCDALNPPDDEQLWDLIVSNPPYIADSERKDMEPLVLDHEPSLALFVPDNDALRFYRSISRYAAKALKPGGSLLFEINPRFADETAELMRGFGLSNVEIVNDDYGHRRFAIGERQKSV